MVKAVKAVKVKDKVVDCLQILNLDSKVDRPREGSKPADWRDFSKVKVSSKAEWVKVHNKAEWVKVKDNQQEVVEEEECLLQSKAAVDLSVSSKAAVEVVEVDYFLKVLSNSKVVEAQGASSDSSNNNSRSSSRAALIPCCKPSNKAFQAPKHKVAEDKAYNSSNKDKAVVACSNSNPLEVNKLLNPLVASNKEE